MIDDFYCLLRGTGRTRVSEKGVVYAVYVLVEDSFAAKRSSDEGGQKERRKKTNMEK